MSQDAQTVLIVDDEPQILRFLGPALSAAGYAVVTASAGKAAIEAMAGSPPEAMILDLGLPDIDGKEVIARVREFSTVPIIVLSARDLEAEKIAALDLGADDFVNKPVGVGELLARLRATLRARQRLTAGSSKLTAGDLEIDFTARRLFLEGDEVKLSPWEYALPLTLPPTLGGVVTHKQVIAAVWGADSDVDAQFVRVLVAQLRSKLEAEPSAPRYVLTEPGVGYRLAPDERAGK